MENIKITERFVPLNIIKNLNKQKEDIEQQINNYPRSYCNICGDTNPIHGFYPLLSSNDTTCNRCRLSDEEYESTFGCKKEIIENICKIHQEDLQELYNDGDEIFNLDEFEFIGENDKIYIFDVAHFNYLCGEFCTEAILGIIDYGTDGLIEEGLCKLK